MEKIKIKYFKDNGLNKISVGDWIDLYTACESNLKKGEFCLIPLGVAMQLPKGYEAHLVMRSSTFKKFKVIQTNAIGIIDNSYCGDNDEWKLPVYAMEDTYIPSCERICQFRIVKTQPDIEFISVESLGNCDRGGFGSTDENKIETNHKVKSDYFELSPYHIPGYVTMHHMQWYDGGDRYVCELTDELDKIVFDTKHKVVHHYVYVLDRCDKTLTIRIPGHSLGYISIDNDGKISKVWIINTDGFCDLYPEDIVDDKLSKYIGNQIRYCN